MKKNLVMGVAKGYGWDVLEPFVISFKRHCSNAELVLFVDDISDFTRDRLISCEGGWGVNFIPAEYKDVLIIHTRWKLFADFLDAHGDCEQVFVTDTADVIFQGDVFSAGAGCEKYLGYATEADDIRGSKTANDVNYKWLEHCFGKDMAERLALQKVVCCGTVVGTANEMKILCRIMWETLKDDTIWGHEQAVMNCLVYEKLLPIENLIEHDVESGEIFTPAQADVFPVRGDKILRGDGGVPAVVHQYNRHDEFIRLVDRIYRDKNFEFNPRFVDTRSIIEQATCLLLADKVFDAARLCQKTFRVDEDFGTCVKALIRLWEVALRKDLSRASGAVELAAQGALKTVKQFSSYDLEKICRLLRHAREGQHLVDDEFKTSLTTALRRTAEQKLAAKARGQYQFCVGLLKDLGAPFDEQSEEFV